MISGFKNYAEKALITEALNTPIEFYMTDDTELPRQIMATAKINGTDYGFSLVQSTYDRVYLLDLYRIVNVHRRSWNFKNTADILPALSTALKFMESSYPFIKSKMDAIIVELPGKDTSNRYEKFVSMMIQKSYIKTFKMQPVIKTTNKARNYVFILKKTVEPSSVFKSAAFKKNFKFTDEVKQDSTVVQVVTAANVETLSVPYKTLSQVTSVAPSKKYAFGKLDVDNVIDNEEVASLDILAAHAKTEPALVVDLLKNKEPKATTPDQLTPVFNFEPFTVANTHSISLSNIPFSVYLYNHMSYKFRKVVHVAKGENKLESLLKNPDITTSVKDYFGNGHAPIQLFQQLKTEGMLSPTGALRSYPKAVRIKWLTAFNTVAEMVADYDKFWDAISNLDTIIHKFKNPPYSSSHAKVIVSKKLDLPFVIASTHPAFQKANESKYNDGDLGFVEEDEKVAEKKKAISEMPGIKEWYADAMHFKTNYSGVLKEQMPGMNALHKYTSSYYSDMNGDLRTAFKSKQRSDWGSAGTYVDSLVQYFHEKAPALTTGVWVYRNTDIPNRENLNVGDDIIDPGFMSTSVRSQMALGSPATRLKIFLPAGTRCFPVFEASSHPGEDEIVLPPMSVLKITERHATMSFGDRRDFFVTTYTGNAMKSFYDNMQAGNLETLFAEAKVNSAPTDKDDMKWLDKMVSAEEMKKIEQLLKSGKLKKSRT